MTDIIEAPFADALSSRYLVYALSTITARALPDVRDGLKPVHRRLLWAMRLLKLDPKGAPKKCARVVGDVIGKYHPHGEQSVYDALVRLAQDFALRYPLVEGQGNFGNVDGDGAAAMRYTEARLTPAALALMDGLDDECVPFRPTYNGEEEEPEVMPGLFPNLLANGASGIAVGMATAIPPHNVGEVLNAAVMLLADPAAADEALIEALPGPDFPGGGVLVDDSTVIARAYASGKGSLRLRARWRDEKGLIVVDEIPYGVAKGKLIEAIAALVTDKKLPGLADIRDESAESIRIVLEPRARTVDKRLLMDQLFRLTDLEVRVPVNMTVLDQARRPMVMGLRGLLQAWLDHALDVQLKRARFRLARIEARLEVLDGLLRAYLNLDAVIGVIRDADRPKPELMAAFELSATQAEAILEMRLRALNKLQSIEIEREAATLAAEQQELAAFVAEPRRQQAKLKAALNAARKAFADPRRTLIEAAPEAAAADLTAFIAREPVTIVVSAKGWVRALKGHAALGEGDALKFKEGDGPAFAFHAQTTDRIVVLSPSGRSFTLLADRLPGGRGFGEPLRLLIDLEAECEPLAVFAVEPEAEYVLAASDGRGFVVNGGDLIAETRKGRTVMTPREGARLAAVRRIATDADALAVVGENRRLLVLDLAALPRMGRGQGVQLQRYKDGGLSDLLPFRLSDGLSWPSGERRRTERDLTPWRASRGQAGRPAPQGFPRNNRFDG
ncbi:MAG: DNA topoisomerase IV subunit A [Sphingomonadaceae bacterium]|nr:DNA topoisomerase IV subunit A [Sphingomonadaceae bacterium]